MAGTTPALREPFTTMTDHYEFTIENRATRPSGLVAPGDAWDRSADGCWRVVAGQQPGEFHIVSARDGVVHERVETGSARITTAVFHPTGELLAVGLADGVLAIYALTGVAVWQIAAHRAEITALVWNASGTELATASLDGSAKVFAAADGQLLAHYQRHRAPVRGIAFAMEGDYLISSGDDQRLHVWRRDRPDDAPPRSTPSPQRFAPLVQPLY